MIKKVLINFIFVLMFFNLYPQIGTHIPNNRLPDLEQSWWDSTEMVLPWQNAGCLKQIEANHSLPKHILQCVSEEGEINKN